MTTNYVIIIAKAIVNYTRCYKKGNDQQSYGTRSMGDAGGPFSESPFTKWPYNPFVGVTIQGWMATTDLLLIVSLIWSCSSVVLRPLPCYLSFFQTNSVFLRARAIEFRDSLVSPLLSIMDYQLSLFPVDSVTVCLGNILMHFSY